MEMGLTIVRCGNLRVALWLHTDRDPPQDQWDAAMTRLAAVKKEVGGDVSRIVMLVVTDGGAPDALMRKELFTVLLEGKVKTSAVTTVLSNKLKRGITTAILWLNPNFRAFGPDQLLQALEHLDVASHGPALLAALRELQKSVSPTKTLPLLRLA